MNFNILCETITEHSFCYLHLDKVWSVVLVQSKCFSRVKQAFYLRFNWKVGKGVFPMNVCGLHGDSRYSSWMLKACLMPTWVQPGPPSLELIKYACTLILKILRKDGTRASYDQVNKVRSWVITSNFCKAFNSSLGCSSIPFQYSIPMQQSTD